MSTRRTCCLRSPESSWTGLACLPIYGRKTTCESCGDIAAITSRRIVVRPFSLWHANCPRGTWPRCTSGATRPRCRQCFRRWHGEDHNPPVRVAWTCNGKWGCDEDGGGASTGHVMHPIVRVASTQPMADSSARIHLSMVVRHRGPSLETCVKESRACIASRGLQEKPSCRPKNGALTAMGAADFSGLELSMGYDGELGIDGLRIAANACTYDVHPQLSVPWQRAGLVSEPSYPGRLAGPLTRQSKRHPVRGYMHRAGSHAQ